MKVKINRVICIFLLIVLILSVINLSSAEWTEYGADLKNTSNSKAQPPYIEDENKLVWQKEIEGDVESTSAIYENYLFVGDDDGVVHLFNVSSDSVEEMDSYKTNSSIMSTIAYDGKLFVSNREELYAFNLTEENKLERAWYYKLEKGDITSSPVPVEDEILLCYQKQVEDKDISKVISFDKEEGVIDGEFNWKKSFDGEIKNTPAVKDNRVYISIDKYNEEEGSYGEVICLGLDSGNKIWTHHIKEGISTSPSIKGDLLFVGSFKNKIISVNIDSKNRVFEYNTSDYVIETFAIKDNFLYYSTEMGIYCVSFEGSKPELKWKYIDFEAELEAPPSLSKEMLFIGTPEEFVYTFDSNPSDDKDQGHEDPVGKSYDFYWEFEGDGAIESQIVCNKARIYFGTDEGYVYSLGDNRPSVSITATEENPKPGETIKLISYVEDEGKDIEYNWYCEKLGDLGNERNITLSLDEGDYNIKLEVTDENGHKSFVREKEISVEKEKEEDNNILYILIALVLVVISIASIYYIYTKKGENNKSKDEFKYWEEN